MLVITVQQSLNGSDVLVCVFSVYHIRLAGVVVNVRTKCDSIRMYVPSLLFILQIATTIMLLF